MKTISTKYHTAGIHILRGAMLVNHQFFLPAVIFVIIKFVNSSMS